MTLKEIITRYESSVNAGALTTGQGTGTIIDILMSDEFAEKIAEKVKEKLAYREVQPPSGICGSEAKIYPTGA